MRVTREVVLRPPTTAWLQAGNINCTTRKRVAAYARVSTDTEEQQSSYDAQVDYYSRHIQDNAEWEFIEVYADEGISATSTKNREGFKRMIIDALAGKIDLILTKSVSRFARNTVDTLVTVRQLKEKRVEVYFEKENIYTFDSKGELMLTILSSIAQEESRSISENVTWGQRKRFADGKVSLPYKQFLGYEKGADDLPQIVEEQAKVIRLIYRLFLEGQTPSGIASYLSEKGILTPSGRTRWQSSTVESILSNEKYKGDAILQKSFTVNFLTKKMKINEGEVPQYYIENSHPAIISPEVFDLVQQEIQKRKANGYTSRTGCFSSKLICEQCGSFYGSKVWHSNSKYRRTIWQCNCKFKNGAKCRTPHLYEDDINTAFVSVINSLINNKEEIIEGYKAIIQILTDTSVIDAESANLQSECDVVQEFLRKCVEENAHVVLDQDAYQRRYASLIARYDAAKKQLDSANEQRQSRRIKRERLNEFIIALGQEKKLLKEFDEDLWNVTVDSITIHMDDKMVFSFLDGSEVPVTNRMS